MTDTRVYDYTLPAEFVAQRPAEIRSQCRLFLSSSINEEAGDCKPIVARSCLFSDLPHFLGDGDLVVVNNTGVSPRRIFASDERREYEFFLETKLEFKAHFQRWQALCRPRRRLKVGDKFALCNDFTLEVLSKPLGSNLVEIELASKQDIAIEDLLEEVAVMPIPPYIRDGRADRSDVEDYQTVFARRGSSLAASTAALHFDSGLLSALSAKGVSLVELALDMGMSSIVSLERTREGGTGPSAESFEISAGVCRQIHCAKEQGRRVVAIGTSVVRALESVGRDGFSQCAFKDEGICKSTDLLIAPGFEFELVELLVTNFHQPGSSHLALVSAFAGASVIGDIYEEALRSGARFLSYGDAMLLERNVEANDCRDN